MRIFALLGALATAGSLWLNWYALGAVELEVTGWKALHGAGTLLAVLAAVVFFAVVLREGLMPLARIAAIVAIVVVATKIVDRPPDPGHVITGAWVALGGAVAMVAGAFARDQF